MIALYVTIMTTLGQASNLFSDAMPSDFYNTLHVLFTAILN